MALQLFPHNQRAWASASDMLKRYGKAAVIHPTGTGKTYIAFALCEANPDVPILWLSPSSYIFRTQREALRRSCPELSLENVCFITYAKLMLLTDEELERLRPAYIILDEFHRCGAQMWGQGVCRLLDRWPQAKILGLSATNIRYLDNQRDMAAELFDDYITSELTLGEAIVRGILAAPKYITSIYSCQKELERYQQRVDRAKNGVVRNEAQRLLDALRRAVDKADGLDVVFQRHMEERTGKYLIFCSDLEHMEELAGHIPGWFGKIDPAPHVYRAYSNDPETSLAFQRFKEDDSRHLKLLLCIDMLNEGIHVENVSGVILFRPTVSPVVYKQQIGRALSAGTQRRPVIFDVVNNFENLYSIGAVEQELQIALSYYRVLGQEADIVQDRFTIFDEARDCRRLFEALDDTLSASWELMYQQARKYFGEHGDLEVPKRYKTPDGYSLGAWVATQRRVRAGQQYGRLSPERIARLDAIGMVWENRSDLLWERYLQAAAEYREQYGNLDVPAGYITENGAALGQWIRNIRQQRASGIRMSELTPERITRLDELGMIWDKYSVQWERNFLACSQYYLEHGDLEIPSGYVSPEGLRIGSWLRRLRRLRKGGDNSGPTEEQIARLDSIGMDWCDAYDRDWEKGYRHAVQYRQTHGDLEVPITYVCPDGFRLGKWLGRHLERNGKTGIRVTPERRERLTALGMQWTSQDAWQVRFDLAKEYRREHGDLEIPADFVKDGIWLGKWLREQRQIMLGRRKGKTLTKEQEELLKKIGFDGLSSQERAWEEQYAQAKAYAQRHGNLEVPAGFVSENGKRLDIWVSRQRAKYRKGELSQDRRHRLEAIGMTTQEEKKHGQESKVPGRTAARHGHTKTRARL